MIQETLANSASVEGLHPRFKAAFDFLKSRDLANLAIGRYEIDGDNLFVLISEVNGKKEADATLETHKAYIDIQSPITATERMGWLAEAKLGAVKTPYNPNKDIAFFEGLGSCYIDVQPSEFAIFFPSDAHAPGIGCGSFRKAVVKVKI